MKKLMMIGMMFFAILLVTPAWSHHPAEGIVSDEIWTMVDDLLVDSPHLTIDFDNIMESMGSSTQVSSTVVSDDDVGYIVDAIGIAIDELSENNNGLEPSVSYEIVPLDDNVTEIVIYETLGYAPSFAGNK